MTKKRVANSEQQTAIAHQGGVLLSAGAGSGKTFVLVEHLIYLLTEFDERNGHLEKLLLEKKLKTFLSSIVYMTFTNKAASELESRIKQKISPCDDSYFCSLVAKNIDSLNITTIDGFCYKIINAGMLAGIAPITNIMDNLGLSYKIKKLFRLWQSKAQEKRKYPQEEIDRIDYFAEQIIESLAAIFADPISRSFWEDPMRKKLSLQIIIEEIFKLHNLNYPLYEKIKLSDYAAYQNKAWYKAVEKLNELKNKLSDFNQKSFEYIREEIFGVRCYRTKNDNLPVMDAAIDDFEIIRNFLKKHQEDFFAYFSERDLFTSWEEMVDEIYNFISKHYLLLPGATFADLEYLTWKALDDQDNVKRVGQRFSYFVIDEFQDTSSIQYEIIKKIIRNDMSLLFCVGDLKQAIYGFRGGELAVFNSCSQEIGRYLSLRNNYRSDKGVIDFNNSLFDFCLQKGQEYEGHDSLAVTFEKQHFPEEKEEKNSTGACYRQQINVSDYLGAEKKVAAADLGQVEANALLDVIKQRRQQNAKESIAVLYARTTHARVLVELLKREKIPFVAQIKVEFGEDPVVEIFRLLLEYYQAQKHSLERGQKKYEMGTKFFLANYLKIIKISITDRWLEQITKRFVAEVDSLGLAAAFNQYLFSAGISNPHYRDNIKVVFSIISSANEEVEECWQLLNTIGDKKYSTEYHYQSSEASEDSDSDNTEIPVQIMTVHASKGLEFDHVFLASIHSNGHQLPKSSWFGKLPGSFRWKKNYNKGSAYKSPRYILENELAKYKDFSESKRLFYVACTRAIKTVNWTDIYFENRAQIVGKNSWINALRLWESEKNITPERLSASIANFSFKTISDSRRPPFFLNNGSGICARENESATSFLAITSEVSVTRLATLISCPFKFYLQNICTIEEDELPFFAELSEEKRVGGMEDNALGSSAARGISLHEAISFALKNEMRPEEDKRAKLSAADQLSLQWIIECLKEKLISKNYQIISEMPFKFPLYGLMVNGVPDLILRPIDSIKMPLEIWDFKSGRHDIKGEKSYWFQLQLYAYATYMLGYLDKSEKVSLILSYLGEQKNLEITLDFAALSTHLLGHLRALENLSQKERSHCPVCLFQSICKK